MYKRLNLTKFALVAVFCLFSMIALEAQVRSTTVIASKTEEGQSSQVTYTFNVNKEFFSNITTKNLTIELSVEKNDLNKRQVINYVIQLPDNSTNIGSENVDNTIKDNLKFEELDASAILALKSGELTIVLKLDKKEDVRKAKKIKFYTNDSALSSQAIYKQPKLIIDYEVNQEPYRSDWAQVRSDAQHTNRTNWKLDTDSFLFLPTENSIHGLGSNICVYNDSPVIFTKDENKKHYAKRISNDCKTVLGQVEIDGATNKQPVIDSKGRMYYFSTNDVINVIDLETMKSIEKYPLKDIRLGKGQEALTINSIQGEVTIGFDGILYMPVVNKTGNTGIIALNTKSPKLNPIWFFNTTNFVGPVSLSENEKFAFFIEQHSKNESSRLVVLDNTNGKIVAKSEYVLKAYKNDIDIYIPPVVIQKNESRKTNVYVLDGYKTSNKLFVFCINQDELSGSLKDLKPTYEITTNSEKNEGISQPVVTSDNQVYFIKNKILTKYETGRTPFVETPLEKMQCKYPNIPQQVTDINDISILNYKDGVRPLNEFSNNATLLTNASNNLYIISAGEFYFLNFNKDKAYYYSSTLLPKKNQKKHPNNMILSPSSILYGIDGDKIMRTSVFHTERFNNPINLTEIKNKTAYINQYIILQNNVRVNSKTDAILSGRRIDIKKGFTVKKGAQLSFKTFTN